MASASGGGVDIGWSSAPEREREREGGRERGRERERE
jgi:hypothetical protein